MQAHITSLHTPGPQGGVKRSQLFSERNHVVMLPIELNGMEHRAP